jgi:16S rRNA (uracil1498-N3)-methyltransferase
MSLPRFFVPEAHEGDTQITLPPDEAHHLAQVLRLRAGADVRVFNGAGREWLATVESVSRRAVELRMNGPIPPATEPAVYVTLGIGVLKGDQMDTVVRDATALGVSAIAPLVSANVTVPSRAWKGDAAIERWRRVAIASAKQCGRAVVPAIDPVAPFAVVLDSTRADLVVMSIEPSLAETAARAAPLGRPSSALVLIGPEGGWTSDEVNAASGAGARFMHLGPRTLRAETAPIVLLSSLWTMWGW